MTEEEFLNQCQEWLNGNLNGSELENFELELKRSKEFRKKFIRLTNLDSSLRDHALVETSMPTPVKSNHGGASLFHFLALAAVLLILVGLVGVMLNRPASPSSPAFVDGSPETVGVAVVTAEANAVWARNSEMKVTAGSPLAPGTLRLEEGLVQIEFFGGASVSLSGPAEIELVSGDRAVLRKGRLKADVPPAARGFEIQTGDVLLEDLGTTFGLAVSDDDNAELIVFDGEVVARGVDGETMSLTDGQSAMLAGGIPRRQSGEQIGDFPGIEDVYASSGNRNDLRYSAWKERSLAFRNDPRIIAYFDFENLTPTSRRLKNCAASGSEFDGGIVGARATDGRWKGKTALDFRREGDRVRFHMPVELDGLTIFAWVRIDALDRHLNSLFLTDYFDEHEFHWQLSRKGMMHFASSPEGVRDIPANNRRFYSEQFWDPGNSGQWFHLATTVSTGVGGVTHYVNGKEIGFSGGTQMHKPLEKFVIGEADLGNWSKTIEKYSKIRTLNGRIDEFAILGAPMSSQEILELYEVGKP